MTRLILFGLTGALLVTPVAAQEAEGDSTEVETETGTEAGAEAEPIADPIYGWMSRAYDLKEAGDFAGAREAVEQARLLGADQQYVALELGYIAAREGDLEEARAKFEQASRGPDTELAERALAELEAHPPPEPEPEPEPEAEARPPNVDELMFEARTLAAADDYDGALAAFDRAREAGADSQVVALEIAYLHKREGRIERARDSFREAKEGPDEARAAQARAELKVLPRVLWADLYADVFSWYRFYPTTSSNLVPTLRLRGYLHPIARVDLDFYLFFQISRDLASRSQGPQGYPLIYADNTAMMGIGAQFRFWHRRVGLFAQIGPAFKLVPDGAGGPVELDFRAGAFFGHESPKCRPKPQLTKPGARLGLDPCADVYADAVYVSRFDHNVFFYLRGRIGLSYLVTGPVSWAPFVEGRFLKDVNNDYWNNLIDAGVGHRWRLLKPFGLDLMLGIHGGTYFGLEGDDPAPRPLTYAELRFQIATYVQF